MQHKGVYLMPPLKTAIVGAGSRGYGYGNYILKHPDEAQVVAVADPDDYRRNRMKKLHNIPDENCFTDFREMLDKPRLADAVIIATQDKLHVEPTVAFAKRHYHILLEKPMATDEAGCRMICDAVCRSNIVFGVCFVLRYSPYFRKLRELIHSGVIGELITFRHIEKVGYWHQAHSFVRGNWRNSAESCPMLLAKSCHDMDILNFLVGKKCLNVTSFGSLKYFTAANRPAGAADRCMDCKLADECIYSAKKFYFERLNSGAHHWPLDVITSDMTEDGVSAALKNGPYGRCVFACDNDVVDNQVLNFLYEGNITGTMTMTAFSNEVSRESEFRGTHGEIHGDGNKIKVTRFGEKEGTIYDVNAESQALSGGHGGGDAGLMRDFLRAVAANDQSLLGATPQEMLAGHFMAFDAEKFRNQQ